MNPCRCVIQDVLDKVLGVCDEAHSSATGGSEVADRRAVTLEFYSVTYQPDGATCSRHGAPSRAMALNPVGRFRAATRQSLHPH